MPNSVRNRRNVHLQKQPDVIIIASYLWAIQEGCGTVASIYRAIRHTLFPDSFPEPSRFCRICQNLSQSIQRMRYFMVRETCQTSSFALIDSFPVDYVVTQASIYDGDVAFELLKNSPIPLIYGDKGYVDKTVKNSLSDIGVHLISQLRKNMAGYSWFENYKISRLRKPIETVFSSLEQFGIEHLRCRNLQALKFRVEAILLTYSLLLENSQDNFGQSLRYSLAYT